MVFIIINNIKWILELLYNHFDNFFCPYSSLKLLILNSTIWMGLMGGLFG